MVSHQLRQAIDLLRSIDRLYVQVTQPRGRPSGMWCPQPFYPAAPDSRVELFGILPSLWRRYWPFGATPDVYGKHWKLLKNSFGRSMETIEQRT